MRRAYVQLYTGEGKGKTTAAVGLCLRALGAGLSVYLGQFIKARASAEIAALRDAAEARGWPLVTRQFGLGRFDAKAPGADHIAAAREGFAQAKAALASGRHDLVVLDEICVAAARKLLSEEEVLALVADRPASVELVLTGRYASPAMMAAADLVTEMRAVKHYRAAGVNAREGIEL